MLCNLDLYLAQLVYNILTAIEIRHCLGVGQIDAKDVMIILMVF